MSKVIKFNKKINYNPRGTADKSIKLCNIYNNDDNDIKEKKLENIVINNLNKLEKGMKFVSSQYKVAGGIIDILARDKNDILCIIELKVISNCKDLVYQCLYYPTQFRERTRMIVLAPDINSQICSVLNKYENVEKYKYYIDKSNRIYISKIIQRKGLVL
jgi:RecB family endonuclease NucS